MMPTRPPETEYAILPVTRCYQPAARLLRLNHGLLQHYNDKYGPEHDFEPRKIFISFIKNPVNDFLTRSLNIDKSIKV